MLDGVLVLNEILDFSKKNKKECMLVNVDFEKSHVCITTTKYIFCNMLLPQNIALTYKHII